MNQIKLLVCIKKSYILAKLKTGCGAKTGYKLTSISEKELSDTEMKQYIQCLCDGRVGVTESEIQTILKKQTGKIKEAIDVLGLIKQGV